MVAEAASCGRPLLVEFPPGDRTPRKQVRVHRDGSQPLSTGNPSDR
jgi:hypothetical protein